MEHAVPFDAVRPWRTAAIVASALAALELLLIAGGAAAILAHPFRRHAAVRTEAARPVARRTPANLTKHALLPRRLTSVLVLNGSGAQGAAAAQAARLSARGYPIRAVGNAPRPSTGPTIVMFRPGFQVEAQRLARDQSISSVGPLDGLRARELHGAELVVLLGR